MNRSEVPTMTGVARTFPENEIIVSKTDPTGRLVYVNNVFERISGFNEDEVIGEQHSVVRHPEMPRCVFKLLWDTLEAGKEIFAYINNRSKNGDHYWVFAHVTPTFGSDGSIVGYHSNRRTPRADAVTAITPIYKQLCDIEETASDRKSGMASSFDAFHKILADKGVSYDKFVLAL